MGGIRYQIENGVNGYLVSSVEEAADRIVQLVTDERLRKEMGERARKSVKEKFLLSRYLEQYLDLFNAIEPVFQVRLDRVHTLRSVS